MSPPDPPPPADADDAADGAPEARAADAGTVLNKLAEQATPDHLYITVPTVDGEKELVFDSIEEAAELYDLLKGTSDEEPFELPTEA